MVTTLPLTGRSSGRFLSRLGKNVLIDRIQGDRGAALPRIGARTRATVCTDAGFVALKAKPAPHLRSIERR